MIPRLQRYLGWAAIPNITVWIIALQVAAYLCLQAPVRGVNPDVMLSRLQLIPERVWAGEVWRIITFLFTPPLSNIFFAFFAWYLFWIFGTALEAYWGTFRYNVYLWIGWAATVVVALVSGLPTATNAFLELSVFLAFAALCPDFTILIGFILPVKIKWIAAFTWVGLAVSFATGGWAVRATIAAMVCNFLIFFARSIWAATMVGMRRMRRKALQIGQREPEFRHKCSVCGVTDAKDRSIEFRYCSQCEGNRCYCSDHLRSHEHVRAESGSPSGAPQ